MTAPSVSVVIATTCEAKRGDVLREAVRSVLEQEGMSVELILVVNGNRYDHGMLEAFQSDPSLRVHRLTEGNFPAAVRYGRSVSSGQFIAFLDDDDRYLTGALKARLEPLLLDPSIDFVATNGYVEIGDKVELMLDDGAAVNGDPFAVLMRRNWLASSGALFRASTVGADYFPQKVSYFNFEWTLLAFNLMAAGRKLHFLDVPTFHKRDTPESLYKLRSPDVLAAGLEVCEYMIAHCPTRLRFEASRKYADALHEFSDHCLGAGEIALAWHYHIRSAVRLPGFKYAVRFTPRLLVKSLLSGLSVAASKP